MMTSMGFFFIEDSTVSYIFASYLFSSAFCFITVLESFMHRENRVNILCKT